VLSIQDRGVGIQEGLKGKTSIRIHHMTMGVAWDGYRVFDNQKPQGLQRSVSVVGKVLL
jgi:hypothetical protein